MFAPVHKYHNAPPSPAVGLADMREHTNPVDAAELTQHLNGLVEMDEVHEEWLIDVEVWHIKETSVLALFAAMRQEEEGFISSWQSAGSDYYHQNVEHRVPAASGLETQQQVVPATNTQGGQSSCSSADRDCEFCGHESSSWGPCGYYSQSRANRDTFEVRQEPLETEQHSAFVERARATLHNIADGKHWSSVQDEGADNHDAELVERVMAAERRLAQLVSNAPRLGSSLCRNTSTAGHPPWHPLVPVPKLDEEPAYAHPATESHGSGEASVSFEAGAKSVVAGCDTVYSHISLSWSIGDGRSDRYPERKSALSSDASSGKKAAASWIKSRVKKCFTHKDEGKGRFDRECSRAKAEMAALLDGDAFN